ncbi:MAG: sensor domain-containing diguanylate cyclase [Spirochaetia bacterium]
MMTKQGKRTIIVSSVFIIGMVLTISISYTIYMRDQTAQREALKAYVQSLRQEFTRFEYSTKLYHEKIESRLQQKREALSGLRELFSGQETVGWKEFEGFVSPIHEQHPEVQGVFWIPRIGREALNKFVQMATEESPPEYQLRIDNEDIPSESADVWPIYFASPVESNRSWLGQNAETHPIFESVFKDYVERKQPWVSIAFSAKGDSTPEDIFLAMNLTAEERRISSDREDAKLYESGVVAVLIHIPRLVETAVEELDTEPLKLYLYDNDGRRIAAHGPLSDEELEDSRNVEQLEESLAGATYLDSDIKVAEGNRSWKMFFVPVKPMGMTLPSEYAGGGDSWLISIIGVLVTILITALAYRITGEILRHKASEEKQRRLAQRDGLTELLNRRALADILEREWSRFYRTGRPLSVLVLDLDHFKAVNDTHGHAAGDDVLRGMGTILHNAARQSDAACRYGGEEFCLILPETDSPASYAVADRIRAELASQTFYISQTALETGVHITCSVGVATTTTSDRSGEDVLHRADVALYSAKSQGRNRVVVAEES